MSTNDQTQRRRSQRARYLVLRAGSSNRGAPLSFAPASFSKDGIYKAHVRRTCSFSTKSKHPMQRRAHQVTRKGSGNSNRHWAWSVYSGRSADGYYADGYNGYNWQHRNGRNTRLTASAASAIPAALPAAPAALFSWQQFINSTPTLNSLNCSVYVFVVRLTIVTGCLLICCLAVGEFVHFSSSVFVTCDSDVFIHHIWHSVCHLFYT